MAQPKGVAPILQDYIQWVDALDDRLLNVVLTATSPDPYAGDEGVYQDAAEKIRQLGSVVNLLPSQRQVFFQETKKETSRVVETLIADIKKVPYYKLENLLKKLEREAFTIDPEKREVVIQNAEAFWQMRNILAAMERTALQDPEMIEKFDTPYVTRLFLLTAPELNGVDRVAMISLERRPALHGSSYIRYVFEETLRFLSAENGDPLKDPNLSRLSTLEEFEFRFSKLSERKRMEYYKNLYKPFRQTIADEMNLKNLSNEDLMKVLGEFENQISFEEDPQVKRRLMERKYLVIWELLYRGFTPTQMSEYQLRQSAQNLENSPKPYATRTQEILIQVQRKVMEAMATKSRWDNYRLRFELLEDFSEALQEESRAKVSSIEEMSATFNGLIDYFTSTAFYAKIPITFQDFHNAFQLFCRQNNIHLENEVADRDPWTWEQVRLNGKMTLRREQYPKGPHWLLDEWEVAKRITYKGVTLYEMGKAVVETITFEPQPSFSTKGIIQDVEASGVARSIFKNFAIAIQNAEGKIIPFPERLTIFAHEIFHLLQALRTQHGLSGAKGTSLVAEREAYLFTAYALEEYLKLRVAHTSELALADQEIETTTRLIVEQRLTGLAANHFLQTLTQSPFLTLAIEVDPETELDFLRGINNFLIKFPEWSQAVYEETGLAERLGEKIGEYLFLLGTEALGEAAEKQLPQTVVETGLQHFYQAEYERLEDSIGIPLRPQGKMPSH